jgi:hypothetical protein
MLGMLTLAGCLMNNLQITNQPFMDVARNSFASALGSMEWTLFRKSNEIQTRMKVTDILY